MWILTVQKLVFRFTCMFLIRKMKIKVDLDKLNFIYVSLWCPLKKVVNQQTLYLHQKVKRKVVILRQAWLIIIENILMYGYLYYSSHFTDRSLCRDQASYFFTMRWSVSYYKCQEVNVELFGVEALRPLGDGAHFNFINLSERLIDARRDENADFYSDQRGQLLFSVVMQLACLVQCLLIVDWAFRLPIKTQLSVGDPAAL